MPRSTPASIRSGPDSYRGAHPGRCGAAAAVSGADQSTAAALAALRVDAGGHQPRRQGHDAGGGQHSPGALLSSIGMSLPGDFAVPSVLWLAFEHPALAIASVAVAFVLAWLVIWWLSKFLRRVLLRLKMLFGSSPDRAAEA